MILLYRLSFKLEKKNEIYVFLDLMINSPYTINIWTTKGQFGVSIRSEVNTPRQSVCFGIFQQVDFSNPELPKQRDRNIHVKPGYHFWDAESSLFTVGIISSSLLLISCDFLQISVVPADRQGISNWTLYLVYGGWWGLVVRAAVHVYRCFV